MIAVERDSDGIRLAALELMEESLYRDEYARTERIAAQTADPAAALAAVLPKRKFSPGYYVWVSYLLDLEMEMSFGVSVAATLASADITGLFAVREARRQFENEHPACRCGRRMKGDAEKLQGMCDACKDANA
jgi:hypothetical protein